MDVMHARYLKLIELVGKAMEPTGSIDRTSEELATRVVEALMKADELRPETLPVLPWQIPTSSIR